MLSLREICIDVTDLSASVDFYCNVLGLREADVRTGGRERRVHLHCGNLRFTLCAAAKASPQSIERLTFEAYNAEQLFERCARSGVAEAGELAELPTGQRFFSCRDPDGYEIVVLEPQVNRSFVAALHMAPL